MTTSILVPDKRAIADERAERPVLHPEPSGFSDHFGLGFTKRFRFSADTLSTHGPHQPMEGSGRRGEPFDETAQGSRAAIRRLEHLTPRQNQIMDMVLAGEPSKNIAIDLGISRRTVENHRAVIMKKTGSGSIPALARLAFMSAMNGSSRPSIETGRLIA